MSNTNGNYRQPPPEGPPPELCRRLKEALVNDQIRKVNPRAEAINLRPLVERVLKHDPPAPLTLRFICYYNGIRKSYDFIDAYIWLTLCHVQCVRPIWWFGWDVAEDLKWHIHLHIRCVQEKFLDGVLKAPELD